MLYDKKWDQPAEPAVKPFEQWRQTLLDAADLLDQDGWCQDEAKKRGKRCAEQSIADASGNDDVAFATAQARLHAFLLRTIPEIFSIPEWNDHPLRTKDQVIRTMREAAKS